jgi:hypothetical protein
MNREMYDTICATENTIVRVEPLCMLAIDIQAHREILRVGDLIGRDER